MAKPITSIKEHKQTPEEIQQEKLVELQSLLTEQDEAINKILEITGEINDAGILDAVQAMVKAKDQIAGIAVNQVSREPVTNLIKHVMNASAGLSAIDPEVSAKLLKSLQSGLDEAELYNGNNDSISAFDVIRSLNDPDVNRAVKFGLNFLKGMGKGLE
ncbi:DUF1641 domain-containing protein [Sporosarcina pasteurii]|uniref:Uncharacterized conserved protein n=1 Tax=Sporosarcina pasteurii TaxID=1474 RepID=A0A380C0J2_SPOPA|nr:DUF1641 domain-containing protein [Sporosarcina pasteurii]MDS9471451.1 DUF1641 domain-containing protein [Sporosarcina pasteurii]QBQ04926.1 DUF1641 domain-containing protein [Sporosarcina pasteurii]SUJ10096.1 Uncharacterized conserved protein [Sporosarcina pasteurii]